MILSDQTIIDQISDKRIKVDPFVKENLQPSSLDLQLSPQFRAFRTLHKPYIDVKTDNLEDMTDLIEINNDGMIIHPGEFILGSTIEYFEVPDDLVARIEGRSSLGRIGIIVHSTAGYVDPGFKGNITLEITNLSNIPIKLYPEMRIAQISFHQMSSPATMPYGSNKLSHTSKYQGQKGPVASRIQRDYL